MIDAREAPQALGLSKFGTAFDLWLDKRGEGEEVEPTEEQAMGVLVRPLIARLYEAQHDCILIHSDETYAHPEHAWLTATPAFKRARGKIIVEVASVNADRRKEFEEAELSVDLLMHALGILAVMQPLHGVAQVDFGVMVGGTAYRDFSVHYDRESVDQLVSQLAEFRQRIESGSPPAPQSIKDIRRLFARDAGRLVEASPAVAGYVERLRTIKQGMDELEERKEFLQLAIQTHMREASTLIMPDGSIGATFKTTTASRALDQDKLKGDYPDVYENCLGEARTQRRFLLK